MKHDSHWNLGKTIETGNLKQKGGIFMRIISLKMSNCEMGFEMMESGN